MDINKTESAPPSTARRQILFVSVFLVVVVFFVITFRIGIVRGHSMSPTYDDGQTVLVKRRNWFSKPLRHSQVVLLRIDHDVIIKRIYRLPGEEIDDVFPEQGIRFFLNLKSQALANGLSDYYEQESVKTASGRAIRLFVPNGYLVVLGDNLKGSEDSRYFGPVPMKDVLGVVANAPPPPYAGISSVAPGSNNSPVTRP